MEFKVIAVPAAMVGVLLGVVVGVLEAFPLLAGTFMPSAVGWAQPLKFLLKICCLWVICGGAAAAYLLGKKVMIPDLKEGAETGMVFGLVYGVIVNFMGFLVGILFNMISAKVTTTGPSLAETGLFGLSGLSAFGASAFLALSSVVIAVIFGAVGGVLYSALGRRG